VKIAVSGCLSGNSCRYDGRSKKDRFVSETLPDFVEIVQFCPEAEAFGTPRESLRIVKIDGKQQVIGNKSGKNLTEELQKSVDRTVESLKSEDISGVIFKSKSPSCGVERVKVYSESGNLLPESASGLLANSVIKSFSKLPVEEEGRLQDNWLRENFIMQIYSYSRIQNLKNSIQKFSELVDFHSQHKFLLQSKDEVIYRELGKIVADGRIPLNEAVGSYGELFKMAISKKSSRGKTYNVLQHLHGFLKNHLEESEKTGVLQALQDFKNGLIPAITPISIIAIYTEKYSIDYLKRQMFLDPYPKELALRSSLDSYR
jgi:uncharacterized protein YbbK (DUF523 family)/uncharacterized protein YbgA (DUF1722 family)